MRQIFYYFWPPIITLGHINLSVVYNVWELVKGGGGERERERTTSRPPIMDPSKFCVGDILAHSHTHTYIHTHAHTHTHTHTLTYTHTHTQHYI